MRLILMFRRLTVATFVTAISVAIAIAFLQPAARAFVLPQKLILDARLASRSATAVTPQPAGRPVPVEGDFVISNFQFGTGETLPSLNLHYRTLGTPRKDGSGLVRNAVMILHGTGGTGAGCLSQACGAERFGAGQHLEATRCSTGRPGAIG